MAGPGGDRDWALVRASKEAYWRSLDPATRLRLADELRQHALALHPDWPTDAQRIEDLEAHVRLSERLGRASSTRKGIVAEMTYAEAKAWVAEVQGRYSLTGGGPTRRGATLALDGYSVSIVITDENAAPQVHLPELVELAQRARRAQLPH